MPIRIRCDGVIEVDGNYTGEEVAEIVSDATMQMSDRIAALEAELAEERARTAGHASCRETEQRLREANRRLQAEGPALERDKVIVALRAELSEAKSAHENACALVAAMHAAAVGEVRGPSRGVVEDVADLRAEVERLRATIDSVRTLVTTTALGPGDVPEIVLVVLGGLRTVLGLLQLPTDDRDTLARKP